VKKHRLNFLYTFLFVLAMLTLVVSINISYSLPKQPEKKYTEDDYRENTFIENENFFSEDDILALDKITLDEAVNTNINNVFLASSIKDNRTELWPTVVLDAGHGAIDPGSIGPSGTMEKDITLTVVLKLGYLLQKKGVHVVYTRTSDSIEWSGQKQELLERAKLSNDVNADLFISLHTNSSKIESVRGIETYYYKTSINGKLLASIVQDELSRNLKIRNRGIKTEDYSLLRNVNAPSILIELGYISNAQEESMLNMSKYQNIYALSIAKAAINYIHEKD
jgi:N-acetylmuramoyl-L-alanine amidase